MMQKWQLLKVLLKCLILNTVYILAYPTINTVKQESHSGTVDITTFYHTQRPTALKQFFKQMSVFIHLA